MFSRKTVRDINVSGKCVMLHGEFDAPLDKTGAKVASDFRVASAIPTIKYLQKQGCKIVLISKLGRPEGKVDPKQSLKPVAACLTKLLNQEVLFVQDCVGEPVRQAAARLKPGELMMLENLRFHPEEEENSEDFAKQMVADSGAQVFVQDCFALAHRKEVGTDALTRYLPSVAGFHLEKEVTTITKVMEDPKLPLAAIIGGAKIADKIDVVQKLIDMADFVAVAGAMANTFLIAQGVAIGSSNYDKEDVDLARDILRKAAAKAKKQSFTFFVPYDAVVATKVDKTASTRIVDWSSALLSEIEHYPKPPPPKAHKVGADEMILDIGPLSAAFIAGAVQLAQTVIWNGTLGVTEVPAVHGPAGPFAHGTDVVIEALIGDHGSRPYTFVGGGDTVGYVEQRKLTRAFDHVSTGGGASLELMAGKKLPGVEALQVK